MKLIWLSDAKQHLDAIYDFYVESNPDTAVRIYNAILEEVEILLSFPHIGQVEPLLVHYPETFR